MRGWWAMGRAERFGSFILESLSALGVELRRHVRRLLLAHRDF